MFSGYTHDNHIWPSEGEMRQAAKDNNTTLEAVMAAYAEYLDTSECPDCREVAYSAVPRPVRELRLQGLGD